MVAFIKSEIKKNLWTLCTGTVIAQLISLLFYPVLGRLFTPNDFGLLATISSIISLITILGTGKYEQAILITTNKKDAATLVLLSFICALLVGSFAFFFFLVTDDCICNLLNEPQLKRWLPFIPLFSVSIIVYNCYNEWCIKNSNFYKLSLNKIANSIFSVFSKFSFGVFNVHSGLLFGELIGRSLTASLCAIRLFIYDIAVFRDVSFADIKRIARSYFKFPLYILPDQLLNTIGLVVPTLFIAAYYGSKELGYYSMMQNVMAIPMVFVGQAIMDVFRKHASNDFCMYGNCSSVFNKALKYLLIISVLALVLFIVPLPFIFKWVLGEQWQVSGSLAQIYSPAIAFGFICNSLSGVWVIAEKLKSRFYWQLYYVSVVCISLLIGHLVIHTIDGIVFLLSLGLSSAYLISIFYSWKYSKGNLV